MKSMKIKAQVVLASLGLMTALSMCCGGDTVESGVGLQAMVVVLLSGAVLLNVKRQSGHQE